MVLNNRSPLPQSNNMGLHDLITIKSKNGFACRRFTMSSQDVQSFDRFYKKIEAFHQLGAIPFFIFYYDSDKFPLPINNDDNLAKAISSTKPFPKHNNNNNNNNNYTNCNNNNNHHHHQLYQYSPQHQAAYNNNNNSITKLINHQRRFLEIRIESKEKSLDYFNGNLNGKYGKRSQHFKSFSSLILSSSNESGSRPSISMPEDFRQVSSIIDVDIVPETCRRVKIVKRGSDRPLGFFIRDGIYLRMNAQGQLEMVTGIFISRLVPGGLAESTGLLAVNDEVLEVNGIRVTHGKTLDQVTDMMVANSSNLIITIRPGKINNLS